MPAPGLFQNKVNELSEEQKATAKSATLSQVMRQILLLSNKMDEFMLGLELLNQEISIMKENMNETEARGASSYGASSYDARGRRVMELQQKQREENVNWSRNPAK
jgi:hypothetical protein